MFSASFKLTKIFIVSKPVSAGSNRMILYFNKYKNYNTYLKIINSYISTF